MPEFAIQFDPAPFEALDQLALLARQDYNLGGTGDWFGEFRGGLYGFYARLNGVQRHYFELHAWLPRVPEAEYHLASIFFQMDSALECLTYALNAIGWVVRPVDFRDVTDGKELTRITPRDILGDATKTPPRPPLAGYQVVFPTLQGVWQNAAQLISRVRELHDVSKHRRTIFVGGKCRSDPPFGFYEASESQKSLTFAPSCGQWRKSSLSAILNCPGFKERLSQHSNRSYLRTWCRHSQHSSRTAVRPRLPMRKRTFPSRKNSSANEDTEIGLNAEQSYVPSDLSKNSEGGYV